MTETNDHPTQQSEEQPKDDRRSAVNPADNPMPHSPAPDPESVRRGEETWQSVTSK